MFIATCLPVAVTVKAYRMNTMTSPSSLPAKASGVNSVTGPVLPMASRKLATSSFPCLGPYHGADGIAASVDQSTSSVTRSRIAWTSPLPNAAYICLAISMFSLVLIALLSSGPEGGHGRRLSDVLLDGAHPAALDGHQHHLRAVH